MIFLGILFFSLNILSIFSQQAATPPRGWNSYDSYDWIVNETQFLANCQYMADNLKSLGYQYCVVDYLWFQNLSDKKLNIDANGRLQPALDRWPSAANGQGFTSVASKVHAMGLKFGIHTMRGISQAAVDANSPIYGTTYTAKDVAITTAKCSWYTGVMSVNVSHPGGQEFYNSLYSQYATWGVDFIKNDCMFGGDYVPDEIKSVSSAITKSGRTMVYSLSPGDTSGGTSGNEVDHAKQIQSYVNLYRVTGDDWDNWNDLSAHFPVAANFAPLINTVGLNGISWPDLDMLPLGWITTPGSTQGPYRMTSLTKDEQYTQFTLWCFARSPLFYGGDLTHMDTFTLSLITNSEILAINTNSTKNGPITITSSSFSSQANPNVQIAPCDGSTAQQWTWRNDGGVESVRSPGMCLDVWDCGTDDGTVVDLYACNPGTGTGCDGGKNQMWSYHTDTQIVTTNLSSTKCLDVYEFTGPNVDLWTCNGGQNQVWLKGSDGSLKSKQSGNCLSSITQGASRGWVATSSSGQINIALFNLDSTVANLTVTWAAIGIPATVTCGVRDLWKQANIGTFTGQFSTSVNSHGVVAIGLVRCE